MQQGFGEVLEGFGLDVEALLEKVCPNELCSQRESLLEDGATGQHKPTLSIHNSKARFYILFVQNANPKSRHFMHT